MAIFSASGIFFWKWIAVDIGLIVLLMTLPTRHERRLFNKTWVLAGLILVCLSVGIFRPIKLGWWDLRYYPYFQWEVVGESGRSYALEERFMTPYQMYFTFHKYKYLIDKQVYVYSNTDKRTKDEINNDGLEALEKLPRENYFDPQMNKVMKDFLERYFRNLNERGNKLHWLSKFGAPHHIWMFRSGGSLPVYDMQEPVELVRVRYIEKYFFDEHDVTISDAIVQVWMVK